MKALLRILTLGVSSALCLGVAYHLRGRTGLEGAAMGVATGLVLCGVNHALLRWARRARGRMVIAAMMASVIVSFGVILASYFILSAVRREIVEPAVLTTLVVYLAFRFQDVLERDGRGRAASQDGAEDGDAEEGGAEDSDADEDEGRSP